MNEHSVMSCFLRCAALALWTSATFAQDCRPEWSDRFREMDLGGIPRASVVWDDDGPGPHEPALYVGGSMTSAGGILVNGLAKWDGTAWSDVGGGVWSFGGTPISALAVFDDDGAGPNLPALFVAGDFFQAGAVPANWIAKWDGTTWSALGSGLAGNLDPFPTARSLAVFDEDGAGPNPAALFVGGDIQTAGGIPMRAIARWNGSNWSTVGSGNVGGTIPSVYALAVHDIDGAGAGAPVLYAGGMFGGLDGSNTNNLARWNGTAWAGCGTNGFNFVGALASVDHDGGGPAAPLLYVGGYHSPPMEGFVSKFDGTTWSGVGIGPNAHAVSLRAIDDDGAGPAGESLYAGGEFTQAGGQPAEHVARWNGSSWSALGGGVTWPVAPASVFTLERFDPDGPAPAFIYAGGYFGVADGSPAQYFARWDGSVWSSEHLGVNGQVEALITFDEDGAGPQPVALVAAGWFLHAGGQVANRIARHDGVGWSTFSTGMNAAVQATCVFDDDDGGPNPSALFAAGVFTTAGGNAASRIAKWNGSSWSALGAGINGDVYALAVFDDDAAGPNAPALYASGTFSQAGGNPASNIARWDGTTWTALGTGLSSFAGALTVFDSDGVGPLPPALIAGGSFSSAGGNPVANIARWNGSTWSALGLGVGGGTPFVRALTVFDADGAGPALGQLIVGGAFTLAGGVTANRIARFDGSSWSTLGSGMDESVWELSPFDADGAGPGLPVLCAGGNFTTAGGTSARRIATWNGATWSALDGGVGSIFQCEVRALASFENATDPFHAALHVGGSFTEADTTVSSPYLASWGASDCGPRGFCFGDNTGTPCPCSPGATGRGCQNSTGVGALLTATGSVSVAADDLSLVCTGMLPQSLCIFWQGSAQANGGLGQPSALIDGLDCLAGNIVRVGRRGSIGSSASVHRVALLGAVPLVGGERYYQARYRNAASFCTPAMWNTSNGIAVPWTP